MSDEALSRFRTLWQQNYGGVGNAGKTAILEQGMKWQAIGIAPKDAEFIVSRKFQVTEIASDLPRPAPHAGRPRARDVLQHRAPVARVRPRHDPARGSCAGSRRSRATSSRPRTGATTSSSS